ncbi:MULTISPECIES: hypothetical protein [unclassified Lysobacter]|uniref:hypothetical protein n=1 Tax=unclassified Lysobacter TaxID=2635362 RepID=UPI001BE676A5|nr:MULTISPECIES: hypothetical protein [unclassified Lysobacter]MBT2746193.1 hypothetical protein [Lysobacter sp. ISL-42]MBT2750738.1 hypothetical protein [Lysobacter sp. ISL-50]MBT2776115.1 hypothetical protein [Lysobacter sp. ISL-54]MBT2784621.1 hypothetical protein [Lysobacter sp. ISL-52]
MNTSPRESAVVMPNFVPIALLTLPGRRFQAALPWFNAFRDLPAPLKERRLA